MDRNEEEMGGWEASGVLRGYQIMARTIGLKQKTLRGSSIMQERNTDHGRRTDYKRERMKFHFCNQGLGHIKVMSVPK